MALSNSQYNAIMRTYQQQQLQNKYEQDQRKAEVYGKIPAMKELEDAISTTAVSCARKLLDGDKGALGELRETISDLKEQKAVLLQAAGFAADYMELRFRCKDCQDTGYIEGKKCHCFRKAEMKLLYAQSNIESIIQKENFETFTFDYFDRKEVIPGLEKTVYEHMQQVVEICKNFIRDFDKTHGNLLLIGDTGVGKTFLTNCIAKELIDRYYSVIYLSANDLFNVFSKNKFEFHTEEDMKDMYQYILECDLLIIDDLGTELNNSFVSSQLFYCINERLNMRRSTIISTNLTMNQLRDSYSERVASRIMSQYTALPLYGADIRIKKKQKRAD